MVAYYGRLLYALCLLLLVPCACNAWLTLPSSAVSKKVPLKKVVQTTPTPEERRAAKAKETWNTIAWAPAETNRDEHISLDEDSNAVTVFHKVLFDEFQTIKGTFFINGLSSSKIGPGMIHPMEAHGYIKSLTFNGEGSLHLKASIVKTPLAQIELILNFPVARGVMSSLSGSEFPQCLGNAFASKERDTANLVATLWPPSDSDSDMDPVLIVAGDNGSKYCVDPVTMKTKGSLETCFPSMKKEIGGKKLLAHVRCDEERQRLILCVTSFDLRGDNSEGNTLIEFLEFDTSLRLVSKKEFKTRFMVFHDWALTPDYFIVPKNPARVRWADMTKFMAGIKLGVDVFEMDETAVGELILIPRHNDAAEEQVVMEVKADSFFNIFHFGPCYQDHDKKEMVVFANVFDRFNFGGEMGMREFDPIKWSSSDLAPPPRLDKFVIDMKSGTMTHRERLCVLDETSGIDIPVDMPTFNNKGTDGEKRRYSYFAGASRPEGWFPFRSIVKVDLDEKRAWNWDAGDDCVVSEAMFVPRPASTAEDDGFVVSIVHNAATRTCELVVWDSKTFARGPIGTINLGKLMPWCVHGSWSPEYIA
jgi:carotenoid cleavage dioxygenase-like enzyme